MYGILLVTAVAVCVLSRGAIAEPVVTFQGVGPVRIGMTAVAAEQALGAPIRKLDSISGDDGKSCWIGSRADGVDPELTYLFERGKLTRIDVFAGKGAGRAIKLPRESASMRPTMKSARPMEIRSPWRSIPTQARTRSG
jgi:hypothetical protein